MNRGKSKIYTKDDLIGILQKTYEIAQRPISHTLFYSIHAVPTQKVFKRLFGSLENACTESNVPYESENNSDDHAKRRMLAAGKLGEERTDSTGCIMKIVKYNSHNDITVEYQDEFKYRFKTSYAYWKNMAYTNPYAKTIFGVACRGNTVTKINGIKKKSYMVWYAMIQRCYKECYGNKPTYLECSVCDEWLCYENFEKWFNENWYCCNNEVMHLDKDILVKGNKVYSPETCIFVPQTINVAFVRRKKSDSLPYGVKKVGSGNYVASYGAFSKTVYIGTYSTIEEAFVQYKIKREQYIKLLADKYSDMIPKRLYDAMYEYRVDIND